MIRRDTVRLAAIMASAAFISAAAAPVRAADVSPDWWVEGNQYQAELGSSVASAGDVNGDGFDDVILGAPYFKEGTFQVGKAVVYLGSSTGLALDPVWSAMGPQANDLYGHSVAGVGDVNGDGFDDVVVGAGNFGTGKPYRGRAYLYLGSPTGPSQIADWIETGPMRGTYFGWSVDGAGDVNADGYDDVIIGAHGFAQGHGAAFVFLGSSSGLPATTSWMVRSDRSGYLGYSVAGAGDVNGDGFDDVVIGARDYPTPSGDQGMAVAYLGSRSGLEHRPSWIVTGHPTAEALGASLSGAGDVNGDGFDDVIVGAYSYFTSGSGSAFVYPGSTRGLRSTPIASLDGRQADAGFGGSVSGLGDINGDGFDDMVVGAEAFDGGLEDQGRAFVYAGSPTGPRFARIIQVEQEGAHLGSAVSGAGDVNADGLGDLLIGARGFSDGELDEGAAFAFSGIRGHGV